VIQVDCKKIGELIYSLRKEKNMTQKQVADLMNISDKTISKWERGLGCPDVSLLPELSQIFGVNIEEILLGKVELNEP
jgi:transcriptional regulator with XRE-family HTH domain